MRRHSAVAALMILIVTSVSGSVLGSVGGASITQVDGFPAL